MQTITKAKYKEFVDQTVELAKCKDLITKLQHHLKDKSVEIRQLRSKVDYCRIAHHTKTPEEKPKDNADKNNDVSDSGIKVGKFSCFLLLKMSILLTGFRVEYFYCENTYNSY